VPNVLAYARTDLAIEEGTAAVLVSSQDSGIRARIIGALHGQPGLAVSASGSTRELAAYASVTQVLVVHCEELGARELTGLGELRHEHPDLRIVVVCQSADGKGVRRAIDGGSDGLVFIDDLEAALAPTVAAVMAGQTVIPRDLRAGVRKPSLSFRERQILGMVVNGLTNREIGAKLFLAESTVKSHLYSSFTKLGVRSRSEAAELILNGDALVGIGVGGPDRAPEALLDVSIR
jgi:DNA-binding NarL/FixJ family response regulator